MQATQYRISALYVRVSTTEQAREGYSIESQVDRLSAYAKFQGWQNIQIFADEGESAKDMRRPEMQRLISLIKADKVSVVATIAIDRLSRDLLDMLQFVNLCEEHKTAYVCASLNFDTTSPIGRMTLQILSAFAEFERSMIATRVKNTMLDISEKKGRFMAVPPFGYALDENKNLIVVPEEASWLVRAADRFIAGHGYRDVARWLNDNKVPTRGGAPWDSGTVRQILTNELFVGTLVWNRVARDKSGKRTMRDPSEWVTYENAHPAILTSEQWDEIQKRITRRMPKGGQRQMKYKLSGLLRCGECGASMVSRRYGSKGPHKERMIFVCSGYQKRGSCRFHYIFVDQADETVYATLEQLADGDIVIPSEDIEKAVQAIEVEHQRRIAAIDAKFQRQIQAYENGLIGERDLQIARERVEKERELILQERDRIEAPTQDAIRQTVLNQAQQLLWLWKSGELPVVQNALRKLFDHVVVINGSISDFRLSPELYDFD